MDRQLSEWKLALERIWSAAAPDYRAAACLVADIANISEEAMLRQELDGYMEYTRQVRFRLLPGIW